MDVTLGYIGKAENAVLVNIVFPLGCHRVLIFSSPEPLGSQGELIGWP